MNSSPELKNLFEALAKAQGDMQPVVKDKIASKYKYAPLEEVMKASRPALVKHGLCVLQFVQTKEDGEYLITRIAHNSGEWLESSVRMIISPLAFAKGEINQQAVGSAITYYRRYTYAPAVGVVIEGEDDDGVAASSYKPKTDFITQKQIDWLETELEKIEPDFQQEIAKIVYKQCNVQSFADIVTSKFDTALSIIKQAQKV